MDARKELDWKLRALLGRKARFSTKLTIDCEADGARLHIHHPSANMQKDENAFEGWALALRLLDFPTVRLSWDEDAIKDKKHYNRFLYRLRKFGDLFSWFRPDPFNAEHLFGPGVNKYLNHGTQRASIRSDPNSESAYEETLYHSRAFRTRFDFEEGRIGRQLPVGVFSDNPPTAENALFTANSSALDLYGVDRHGTLKLFELKVGGNRKVGAISEILFYAWVLDDVRQGRILPTGKGPLRDSGLTWDDLISAAEIKRYIVSSGTLHPLVTKICSSGLLAPFPVTCIEGYHPGLAPSGKDDSIASNAP